jgi:hypothetical protein
MVTLSREKKRRRSPRRRPHLSNLQEWDELFSTGTVGSAVIGGLLAQEVIM